MNVKTSLSEFECYNNKGEKIDSIEKHLKEREITFSDVLEVGDIIKRKNSNIFYKIQVVHYEILGVGYFDYAGNICNELGENVTTLSQCKPAMDSVFRETRNTKETADFGGGVIPVFGKKYMFIQDGNIIVLQDLSSSSTLAKYESVDTSSYTGQSDGLSFVTTANVYFIAKSASSKKFGVANITSDGVKPVIPFDKDSILTLGDYYVV